MILLTWRVMGSTSAWAEAETEVEGVVAVELSIRQFTPFTTLLNTTLGGLAGL